MEAHKMMREGNYFSLSQTIFITGLTVWMTIIVTNHFFDYDTVYHTIVRMFKMPKLIADPNLGNGIEWRSGDWPKLAEMVFDGVILFQCVIVILLWRATISHLKVNNTDAKDHTTALKKINLALSLMIVMWFLFMCGGLFFGYWMEMGHVQDNHFNFLIMTLVGAAFMNVAPSRRSTRK
jgi:predicted small integral membrane protein